MYEERKERFSVKDILIQILFVTIFVFLLLWLFPIKSGSQNTVLQPLAPLYDQIFNQNVTNMKDAAISYYTTPRLPQKVGEEVKISLSQMLSENLILPFVDSKGNQCDLDESYVSVTKMNDEYIMKVNLKCDNQEDYLLVHLGCYNYCDSGVCEKQEEAKPTVTPTKTVTPKKEEIVQPVVVPDKYKYEYVLVIDGKWGEYSDWSDWTTNIITETNYRDVETKVETVTTYRTDSIVNYVPVYETRQIQTGTKEEAYTDTETVTKYKTVPVYETKQVQVGTKEEAYTDTETVTKYRTVPVYETKQVQTGTKQEAYTAYRTVPVYETQTVQTGTKQEAYTVTEQKFVKMEYALDCTDACKMVEKPVYENVQVTKYRTVPVYETKQVQTGTKQEAYTAYRTVPVYETQTVQTGTKQEAYTENVQVTKYRTVPVYETQKVQTGTKEEAYTENVQVTKYRTVPVYEEKQVQVGLREEVTTVQTPVVTQVTYYRSRTREYISGTVKTEWSESQNDTKLLSLGYTLTGKSEKI